MKSLKLLYFALGLATPVLLPCPSSLAQTGTAPLAASAQTAVPALVRFSGVAVDADGKPLAGTTTITFLIYKEQSGGEPLWTESQTVLIGAGGSYKIQLGAASPNGLPADLFSSGDARWLEVQIAGATPEPRLLLASVPYAMKAGDAATLGGLPASAFALAATRTATSATAAAIAASVPSLPAIGGIPNQLAKFSGPFSLTSSSITDTGGNVGIGTRNPEALLDVNGLTFLRGNTLFTPMEQATAANGGSNSAGLVFAAGVFDSATQSQVEPLFALGAEPVGNNTTHPSATLNLLFNNGAKVAETGLYFNPNGTIHFAPGQTFPAGGGSGTITGVDAGTGLLGGGTAGVVTLSLDTSKVALLSAANTFAGSQAIAGNLSASGTASAATVSATSEFDLGGSTFAFGDVANGDAYMGFAGSAGASGDGNTAAGVQALASATTGYGNSAFGNQALENITTGALNVAVGQDALFLNRSGSANTATGFLALVSSTYGDFNTADGTYALQSTTNGIDNAGTGYNALGLNTNGDFNTANGAGALYNNGSGSQNTAVGFEAGPNAPLGALNNTTALGANATVSQNNSLVLGQTTAGAPGAAFVNVGIGTATPLSVLEASVSAPGALGPALTLTNPGTGSAAVDFNTYLPGATGTYNPSSRIEAVGDGNYGDNLYFFSNTPGSANNLLQTNMQIASNGDVTVKGKLSAAAKDFKIDDPLDPANKYLVHASVESSEMMNIYSGNVITDDLGVATVQLPAWFSAENTDFRYQLTVVGSRFAQAIISTEIENNRFTISTNASNVKVSWQVTAIRQDAYAKANPLVVEQAKPAAELGSYLHPELYGEPAPGKQLKPETAPPASAVKRKIVPPVMPNLLKLTPATAAAAKTP